MAAHSHLPHILEQHPGFGQWIHDMRQAEQTWGEIAREIAVRHQVTISAVTAERWARRLGAADDQQS